MTAAILVLLLLLDVFGTYGDNDDDNRGGGVDGGCGGYNKDEVRIGDGR